MLLAEESTEVAEQNQNGWASEQLARGEDFAFERDEVEVELDPHRIMMRSFGRGCVMGITEARRPDAFSSRRARDTTSTAHAPREVKEPVPGPGPASTAGGTLSLHALRAAAPGRPSIGRIARVAGPRLVSR